MKPILLTFEGFSSFVNRQEINFENFSQKLFLIHGATGSGKTSMLDAITYVLYGQSSTGQRGNLTAMRCQYAGEDMPTSIEFEFYAGNNRYKFYRELKKVKHRTGEISFTENGNAFIYSKDGEYIPMCDSNKVNTVTAKAQEILGLDYKQFCQIIILPQGKFEEFLISNSQEKENILKQLFSTQMWEDISSNVSDKVKLLDSEVSQKNMMVNALLQPIECESISQAVELMESTSVTLTKQDEECKAVKIILDTKENELSKLIEIQKQITIRDRAKFELQQNNERCDTYSDKVVIMEKCKKAENIKPLYENVLEIKQDLEKCNYQLASIDEQAIENELEQKANLDVLAILEQKIPQVLQSKKSLLTYQNALPSYEREEVLTKEYEEKLQNNTLLSEANQSLTGAFDNVKIAIDLIGKEQKEIEVIEGQRLPKLKVEILAQEQVKSNWERLNHLLSRKIQLKEDLAIKIQMFEDEKQQVVKLLEIYKIKNKTYLSSSAFVLADQLEEDKPCPVCGSEKHPNRAKKPSGTATYEQVVHALDILEKKRTQVASTQSERDILDEQMIQVENNILQLSSDNIILQFEPNSLELLYKTQEGLLDKIKNKEALEEKMKLLHSQLEKHVSEQKEIEQELSAIGTQLSVLEGKLTEAKNNLIADFDKQALLRQIKILGDENLAYEQECSSKKEYAQKLERLAHDLKTNRAQLVSQNETLDQRLIHANNVLSDRLAKDSLLDIEELQELLHINEDFSEVMKVLDKLSSERVVLLNRIEECTHILESEDYKQDYSYTQDIEKLQSEFEQQDKRYQEMKKQMTLLEFKRLQIDSAITKTIDLQDELEQKNKVLEKYRVFSKALSGEKGVSLSRYVLGVMMDRIIVGANELLKNVHNGRYGLYRKVSDIAKNKKTGLELEIFDSMSGQLRQVSSLSGGEKFLVALSLSFGLSTAVMANSGGVDINTIFIDEGFGSLDQNSLQDALDILGVIYKNNNRLVGIISHVEQLKEIITTQIEVVKTNRGSIIR